MMCRPRPPAMDRNRTEPTIQLNGEPREIPAESTVADLIEALGLRADQVAVELNKGLVPRTRRGETALSDGDHVELVTLVGGG